MSAAPPRPTLDLTAFRQGAHALSKARKEARRDYERYAEQEADAEREFRKTLSVEYAKARSAGESANGAEIKARAEAADARHKRDIASSLAQSARMRIAELERDAAILRSVAQWSQDIDGIGG